MIMFRKKSKKLMKNIKNNKMKFHKTWKLRNKYNEVDFDFLLKRFKRLPDLSAEFKDVYLSDYPYVIKKQSKDLKLSKYLLDNIFMESSNFKKHEVQNRIEQELTHPLKEEDYLNITIRQFIKKLKYSVVIIQLQLNNRVLEKLSYKLSKKFKIPVGVNAYFTPHSSQTLPLHFDNHSVFLYQVFGKKRWLVKDYCPTSSKQIDIIDTILEPGDILFIPKGYYHEAFALKKEHSFHLTFGVHLYSFKTISEWCQVKFNKKISVNLKRDEFLVYNFIYFFNKIYSNFINFPFLVLKSNVKNLGSLIHNDYEAEFELSLLDWVKNKVFVNKKSELDFKNFKELLSEEK